MGAGNLRLVGLFFRQEGKVRTCKHKRMDRKLEQGYGASFGKTCFSKVVLSYHTGSMLDWNERNERAFFVLNGEGEFWYHSLILVWVAWRLLPAILLGLFGTAQSLVLSRGKGQLKMYDETREGRVNQTNKNKIKSISEALLNDHCDCEGEISQMF